MLKYSVLLVARLVSSLFHPIVLLLPIPYLVIMRVSNNYIQAIRWTFISWAFIVIAGLVILYEVRTGKFTNLDVSRREQRPLLFSLIGITTIVYIFSLIIFRGPTVLLILAMGVIIGLVFLELINTKIKASIHVACVSSILFALVMLYGLAYFWLLFLIPFVAWSRIKLHRHSINETLIGALFGIFLTFLVYAMIEIGLQI